jgi:hypothetical protein
MVSSRGGAGQAESGARSGIGESERPCILAGMKKLLVVLGFVLFVGGGSAWAQAASADIVIVRLNDSAGNVRLVVERGTEKPEIVEFEGGYTEKSNRLSAKGYYEVFAKLYQQGYILQSTIPGPSGAGGALSTLLFVKVPKP